MSEKFATLFLQQFYLSHLLPFPLKGDMLLKRSSKKKISQFLKNYFKKFFNNRLNDKVIHYQLQKTADNLHNFIICNWTYKSLHCISIQMYTHSTHESKLNKG